MGSATDEEARDIVAPKVERDASFYFDDDPMAIFLIENKLFKVHRHFFINGSQIFRDMFSTGDTSEGRTDERPILLPSVTRNEFQTLLRFFYSISSRVLETDPTSVFPGASQFTQEEKLSLLSISHRFLFDDIFHLIKPQVLPTSLSVVTRIRLGDKYDIPEWLSSAYVALLDRNPDDVLVDEAEALGFERFTCLYKAKCFMYQERAKKASESSTNVTSPSLGPWGALTIPSDHRSSHNKNGSLFGGSGASVPVKSGEIFTPTSEVAKKFFKSK